MVFEVHQSALVVYGSKPPGLVTGHRPGKYLSTTVFASRFNKIHYQIGGKKDNPGIKRKWYYIGEYIFPLIYVSR